MHRHTDGYLFIYWNYVWTKINLFKWIVINDLTMLRLVGHLTMNRAILIIYSVRFYHAKHRWKFSFLPAGFSITCCPYHILYIPLRAVRWNTGFLQDTLQTYFIHLLTRDMHLRCLCAGASDLYVCCRNQFHVFELTRSLPKFSMYILVTDTSSITKPQSGITFTVKERVQRVRLHSGCIVYSTCNVFYIL